MRQLMMAALAATALQAAFPAPVRAQTLNIALSDDPDILDPTFSRTYVGRIVFAGLCDKLFDIDQKLAVVPQLALSYTWPSPTELLIKLRPGVLFQDGTKMDAEAVKFSLDRHATTAGSYRRSELSAMDHVDVVDPLTVRVVLKAPSSPFLAQLLDRAGMIVSPTAVKKEGKDFGQHPVCAGPFKFTERVAQDHITLDRFTRYWDAKDIHFDKVIYRPIPDSSIRLANLQAGSIQVAEIAPTDAAAVHADSKLQLVPVATLGYQTIEFNTGNGPRAKTPLGENSLVRRAFEASIDRAAVIQVVYNGLFKPLAQGIIPSSPMYVPSVQPGTRDVAKAKDLLKQAGVKLPVVVKLIVPNNPALRQVGEVIQSMASEAGFDVQLTASEYASALSAAARGDFEAFLTAWSGRVDPDGNLYGFLHTGAPFNDAHYSNPKVDSALDRARAVSDPAQRRAIYGEMMQQTTQDLPILYLWQLTNLIGMPKTLSGYSPVADGMIRLQGMQLAK